jgi:hypothetical protein
MQLLDGKLLEIESISESPYLSEQIQFDIILLRSFRVIVRAG